MNTVGTGHSSVDADLAHDAAAGDAGAFESLYRRWMPHAWRLAHAVAPSRDDAARATTDGFVRALRSIRRNRDGATTQFEVQLLAAVHRSALNGIPPRGEREGPTGATVPASPGRPVPVSSDQLAARAFRTLPQRWRAAVWMLDVEAMETTHAAAILGVSSAAAVQLAKRGRAGLEQRVIQAGGQLRGPELTVALAAAAAPPPKGLAAQTQAKWDKAMAAERRRSTPVAAWVLERAPRPLAACVVGLCAAGVIGLGVVGQHRWPARSTPLGPISAPSSASTNPRSAPAANPVDSSTGATALGHSSAPPTTVAAAGTGSSTTTSAPGDVGTIGTPGPVIVASSPGPSIVAAVTAAIQPPAPDQGPPVIPAPTTTMTPMTPMTPITTTTPPSPPPPPPPQPLVQAAASTGPVGVNLGVAAGSCTGVDLLGNTIGCYPPTTGVSLSVLGQPLP